LRVLDTRKAEVTDLEIAVLIDEDVAWLEIAVDDTCRVDIFQAALLSVSLRLGVTWDGIYEDLVEEVLDELLLERSGCEQSVEISAEQFGDEVDILERRDENVA